MFERSTPQRSADFDWFLWVQWILATTLGWAVGWILSEFVVGVAVGIAQWVVLRKRIEHSEWWIPTSAIGWAAGRVLAGIVFSSQSTILVGGTVGAAFGLAQWLILRRHADQSWWWIVVSVLSWSVGLTGILGAPLNGSIAGAATGLALEPLLRYASMEVDEED